MSRLLCEIQRRGQSWQLIVERGWCYLVRPDNVREYLYRYTTEDEAVARFAGYLRSMGVEV